MFDLNLDPLLAFGRRIQELGDKGDKAAARAINAGAQFAVREGAKDISSQVNLTQQYVKSAGRLAVTGKARQSNLEATVTGRDRPTSLARFSRSNQTFGRQRLSPTVSVARGSAGKRIPGSFFVRLRRGNSGELGNVGIAVRLKAGENLPGKRVQPKASKSGLALLYGPSVGQAFRSAAPRAAGPTSDRVTQAFLRELNRML